LLEPFSTSYKYPLDNISYPLYFRIIPDQSKVNSLYTWSIRL